MQQSVEELFEDLSYEMAPVPCAGQELFRDEIKQGFGEISAGLASPAATMSIGALAVTRVFTRVSTSCSAAQAINFYRGLCSFPCPGIPTMSADGKLPVTMRTLRHMCGDFTPPPSPSQLRGRSALQGDGEVVAEHAPGSTMEAGSSETLETGGLDEHSSLPAQSDSAVLQQQPEDPVSRMARQLALKRSKNLRKASSMWVAFFMVLYAVVCLCVQRGASCLAPDTSCNLLVAPMLLHDCICSWMSMTWQPCSWMIASQEPAL